MEEEGEVETKVGTVVVVACSWWWCVMRNQVFRVSDKVRQKFGCAITEDG